MYILTGGAGFIGSALLSHLNQQGVEDILVVDSLRDTEKWKNLAGKRFEDYLNKSDFLELVEKDRLGKNIEAVIHLGACSSTTETDADYMLSNNYRYSKTLAEWAIGRQLRFIYASSAATYGDGSKGFSDADEIIPGLVPLNVYALSKQLFDQWVLSQGVADKVIGLKFFNVYGPNEYHKEGMRSVVLKAFEQISQHGKVKLFKSYKDEFADGEQRRDFIYVKDCCEVIWKLLNNNQICGIFNLGTGQARTWRDLVNAVFSSMNLEPQIEYIDMPEHLREKYQYFTEAKMDKLNTALKEDTQNYRSLEDGVNDYLTNYLLGASRYL